MLARDPWMDAGGVVARPGGDGREEEEEDGGAAGRGAQAARLPGRKAVCGHVVRYVRGARGC